MTDLRAERIVELENKLVTKVRHCDVTNRIAQLEAERDRWEAAFNSERAACLALQTERDKYKKAIQDYLEGNYPHPRRYRPKDCPHGQGYWEECEQCNDEHFVKALKEVDDGH